jgi:hypothetical protein
MGYFPDGNYLFAEAKILARLAEIFPPGSGVKIGSLGNVSDLLSGNYFFPSVSVIYLGDAPLEKSAGRGAVKQAEQKWGVVIAAKNAQDPRTCFKAREEAGKMFLKAIEGLQGWEVAPMINLARAPFDGSPAIYADGGYVFLTAQFNITVDITGVTSNG